MTLRLMLLLAGGGDQPRGPVRDLSAAGGGGDRGAEEGEAKCLEERKVTAAKVLIKVWAGGKSRDLVQLLDLLIPGGGDQNRILR